MGKVRAIVGLKLFGGFFFKGVGVNSLKGLGPGVG